MIINTTPAADKMDEIRTWLAEHKATILTQVIPPLSSRERDIVTKSQELTAIGFLKERDEFPFLVIGADNNSESFIDMDTEDIQYAEYTDIVFAEDSVAIYDNAILLYICDLHGPKNEWCARIITEHGVDEDRYIALREIGVELGQALIASVKE